MMEIISDFGYTTDACDNLVKMIRKVSETGSLEDFLNFQEILDLAITNRDSISKKEKEIISEIMVEDNYPKELGTGEYLEKIIDFSNYADEVIESLDDDEEYLDKDLLRSICVEGLNQISHYLREVKDRAKFDGEERKNKIREYAHLTTHNPFEIVE